MFRRILIENWHHGLSAAAFALVVLAFAAIAWRVLRAKPEDVDRAARLPLEDDSDRS